MEQVSSSEEDFVCQTCGDKGLINAFVYCVKCLNVAIHRYCLLVMPKTFDECVIWRCEECKVKSLRSQKDEASNSVQLETTNIKKKQKKERKIASVIAGSKEVICQENITYIEGECNDGTEILIVNKIPKKQRTKKKKIEAFLVPKKTKNYNIQNGIQDSIKRCSNESQILKPSCDDGKLISDFSFVEKETNKATNRECRDERGSNVRQSAVFGNGVDDSYYRHAQPVMDPVWMGSFTVLGTNNDLFEGFVAHLSNKACDKVFEEANMMPSLLHVKMQPKTVLWPKSFQECEPSDDKIALYFFPGDPINEKAFDRLVLDMIDEGFAMRAMTKNAELLIFTSMDLPPLFWRFQGKYYLWGVFKGKKNGSTSADSPIEVKKTLTRMKTLDVGSPRSPLSNNGMSFYSDIMKNATFDLKQLCAKYLKSLDKLKKSS